jgi:hypothetical protein
MLLAINHPATQHGNLARESCRRPLAYGRRRRKTRRALSIPLQPSNENNLNARCRRCLASPPFTSVGMRCSRAWVAASDSGSAHNPKASRVWRVVRKLRALNINDPAFRTNRKKRKNERLACGFHSHAVFSDSGAASLASKTAFRSPRVSVSPSFFVTTGLAVRI